MNHLQALSRFVARTRGTSLPPAAIARAQRALIDLAGVTVAGSVEPVSKIIARQVAATSRGNATVLSGGAQALFRELSTFKSLTNITPVMRKLAGLDNK